MTGRGEERQVVGKNVVRVDGLGLVTGQPLFTLDVTLPGMLVAKVLPSPHAHARIVSIETADAEAVPGVECILHCDNTERIPYTTAGQGWPEPSPYDSVLFDRKVRFVGDRVAAVAAVDEDAADEALRKLRVTYEVLPPVLSTGQALAPDAQVIHDEDDARGIYDAKRNIAAAIDVPVEDVDRALAEAEVRTETVAEIPYFQHAAIEPHCVIAYFDEEGRLVLRTATQVPFHTRRIVARLLGLPMTKVRVIKPRIGGGFGSKQEVVLEPVAGALAMRTGRPVAMTYTREEVFVASRTRHPMRVRVKLGANRDGKVTAVHMDAESNTGAYGGHSATVLGNVGAMTLPLYNKAKAVRFSARAAYTNLPVAGAYRGYGATQGFFALETAMDELAITLGVDPVELRLQNHIRRGETSPLMEKLGEGRKEGVPPVGSCALEACIRQGAEQIDWARKWQRPRREGQLAYGVGMACAMQGSGITGIDMGAATLMMNEDGSFRLLVGATDLGTGSDTVLAQIAAEELGVGVEAISVYSSDTDFTPFDVGAYASSTTYVSGNAVLRAAREVVEQVFHVAAEMLNEPSSELELVESSVRSRATGRSVSLAEVGHQAAYVADQHQIAATASFVGSESPPPFGAFFAEVAVDTQTGVVQLKRFVGAADCGTVLNPKLAEGQLEGAMVQGIGHAMHEEMRFSEKGRCVNPNFFDYKVPSFLDIGSIEAMLVASDEPTGPWGAKAVAEIGINGPLPAISNAIRHAVGVRVLRAPFTPERVLEAMTNAAGV